MKRIVTLKFLALMACLLCSLSAVAEELPVAYVEYSGGKMTFYYDNLWSYRHGELFAIEDTIALPGWYGSNFCSWITQVEFNSSFANFSPISTIAWFSGMEHLTTISGLEYLDTSEVEYMDYMFENCKNLSHVDLSHFCTLKAKSMYQMFYNCTRLSSLDLSNFNTSRVTDMTSMFYGCNNLKDLDLSSFNTSKVTDMLCMFEECRNLKTLDLSGFSTARVQTMGYMFADCDSLETIYVSSDWSTSTVAFSSNMFNNCTNLVGGAGTTYDANHIDAAYAHIDGGTDNPGYLTHANRPTRAYAVYTPENTTLTFYYDDQLNHRSGTIYNLITGMYYPEWVPYGNSSPITQVVFDQSFASFTPKTAFCWFGNMQELQSITGLEYLNTSQMTNMNRMFYNCSALTSLDLSNFNTANVTNMYGMFYGCSSLESLDVSSFNTSNVTTMYAMFGCCERLTSLDLSGFNTSNVKNMYCMFYQCSGLTGLDLSSFNTARVTNMSGMFYQCNNLSTIYAGSDWSTAAVSSSDYMFTDCTNLMGGMGTTYDANHVDKTYAHIDGGTDNPGYLSDAAQRESYACYTRENTTLTFYHDCQRGLRSGTTYDLNTGNNNPAWFYGLYNIVESLVPVTNIVFDPSFADARPTSTHGWFFSMLNLTDITGMEYLNTEEVTTMYAMFMDCPGLTSLDLSSFNTENVTDMGSMFDSCSGLTSINISSFNTSKVTRTGAMFYGCSGLTSLDVSSFNTAQVTSMSGMFGGCTGLSSLDVSSFNTAQVTSMSGMFGGCTGLTSLDLSSFNTQVAFYMEGLFRNCNNLTTIYVSGEWSTDSVDFSSDMFKGCTSLVGGKGTTFDADHIDVEYAHIDGGPSNPGYFTDPNAPADPEAYACYTPDNTTLTFYYDLDRGSRQGTTYNLNTGTQQPDWVIDGTNASVSQVEFDPSFADARPTSTSAWFFCMNNLQSISGIQYLNTSEVTIMSAMFTECFALTSLDLSHFNTAKVTNMNNMFYSCTGLTELDLRSFNTERLTTATRMFFGCTGLRNLDLSSFNTSQVTHMAFMFRNCTALTSLDLSHFNTEKVTNMSTMFYSCSNLTTIYVGNGWSTAAVTSSSNMFYNCPRLVGGMGTTFDANHIDAEYAHIDGGPSNPGYFTAAGLNGDVDGDDNVGIADVTALIDYILSGDATGMDVGAADCDEDRSITIADVTTLIDYILSGHW